MERALEKRKEVLEEGERQKKRGKLGFTIGRAPRVNIEYEIEPSELANLVKAIECLKAAGKQTTNKSEGYQIK